MMFYTYIFWGFSYTLFTVSSSIPNLQLQAITGNCVNQGRGEEPKLGGGGYSIAFADNISAAN
jgi:hypothetical protein